MDLNILFISILQGITEFLPISSSAHLLLWGWFVTDKPNLVLDVGAHFGTLFAILVYEYKTLVVYLKHIGKALKGHACSVHCVLKILVATIPVLVVGALVAQHIEIFRNPWVVLFTTVFFGLLLGLADKMPIHLKRNQDHYARWLFMGLSQVLALVPGVSRSGIVITTARFLGFNRLDSIHFSLVLSVPVLSAAGLWSLWKLEEVSLAFLGDFIGVFVLSFLFALLGIHFLIKFVVKFGLLAFMYYRLALGAFIFLLLV